MSFPTCIVVVLLLSGTSVCAQNVSRAVRVPSKDDGLLINHAGQDFLTDTDADGLPDSRELQLGTNPLATDSDGDGFPDGWEARLGFDPARAGQRAASLFIPRLLPIPEGKEGAEVLELSSGWAAGYAWDANFKIDAVRWNLATGEVEIASSSAETWPHAISDSGTIAGTWNRFEGMVWSADGLPARLGVAANHIFYARDVNAADVVVGRCNSIIAGTGAFSWQCPGNPAEGFHYLDAPSGFRAPLAAAINNNGEILGTAVNTLTGIRHAVVWRANVPSVINAITGLFELEQLTNGGEILGRKGGRAFVWSADRGLQFLPTGETSGNSTAWSMNSAGEVVGQIDDDFVLWRRDAQGQYMPAELSTLIDDPDMALGAYYALNEFGEIGGSFDSLIRTYPVVLSPIALPSLSVDLDRDGTIEDAAQSADDETTPSRPFCFWLNDDDDAGDLKRKPTDDVPRATGDPDRDCADGTVDGLRDAEDFFPVFLNIGKVLELLPPGVDEVSYRLSHASAALGVVFTDLARDRARDAIRGLATTLRVGFGPRLDQPLASAEVIPVSESGIILEEVAPAFLELIQAGTGGVILVEASKETNDPLVLDVVRAGEVLLRLPLYLRISPVETMFSYINLRSLAHGTPVPHEHRGPNYGSEEPTAAPNDPFALESSRRNLVFLHGYNVNGTTARGWATAMFKRLYWAGSKARFHAVLWRGDDGQGEGPIPDNLTPDYHRNVGHAWQQGIEFRKVLERMNGETAILAHSLGNVVTMVALTHERDPINAAHIRRAARPEHVTRYFALNAAAPAEALDASALPAGTVNLMRHRLWKNYQRRLWPTDWFRLFDPVSDSRSFLTWHDAFAGLDICTNFYSSMEEVLSKPSSDDAPVLEPIFESGLLSWVAQEKAKGGLGIGALAFRSSTAGWGLNSQWYEEAAGMMLPLSGSQATEDRVATSALPQRPFFRRFQSSEVGEFYPGYQGDRLMAPPNDPAAHDEAQKTVTVAKCLAEGIPAISYAIGVDRVAKLDGLSRGGNFDLTGSYVPSANTGFQNGWIVRKRDGWLHSDCAEMALIYVHPLFDRIVERL